LIKTVSVIGAGVMGNGIAQAMASGKKKVFLYDITDEAIDKGMKMIEKSLARFVKAGHISDDQMNKVLENITATKDLEEAVSSTDLVIEAIPENLQLKKDLFGKLEELTPAETILSTNTSELSVTAIASATKRPEKVIGMHWFNPAPIMKLVEIVKGEDTSGETVSAIEAVSEEVGKETVLVKDFILIKGESGNE